MSGYAVKPPTGDSNEQTQFIDYFNLFYSKRGQEQISISQQLGNYRYNVSCQSPKLLEHVTQRPANIIWIKCAVW